MVQVGALGRRQLLQLLSFLLYRRKQCQRLEREGARHGVNGQRASKELARRQLPSQQRAPVYPRPRICRPLSLRSHHLHRIANPAASTTAGAAAGGVGRSGSWPQRRHVDDIRRIKAKEFEHARYRRLVVLGQHPRHVARAPSRTPTWSRTPTLARRAAGSRAVVGQRRQLELYVPHVLRPVGRRHALVADHPCHERRSAQAE